MTATVCGQTGAPSTPLPQATPVGSELLANVFVYTFKTRYSTFFSIVNSCMYNCFFKSKVSHILALYPIFHAYTGYRLSRWSTGAVQSSGLGGIPVWARWPGGMPSGGKFKVGDSPLQVHHPCQVLPLPQNSACNQGAEWACNNAH